MKDKLKDKSIVSKLLYYDEDRYSKRYCDLRDECWQDQNWRLILLDVPDYQIHQATKAKDSTLQKVTEIMEREQAIQALRDQSF